MSKIKIALIIDTIDPNIGGTERQIILLLKNINRDKFTPYLCCLQDSPWLQLHKDICDIHIINFFSFGSPRSYFNLKQFANFLRQQQIDIVQTFFRDGNIVGTIAAKLAGTNTIISSRRNRGLWNTKSYLLLLRLLNPITTFFVANSKNIAAYTTAAENIPPDKINVIYNGLDWLAFEHTTTDKPSPLLEEFGIHPDDIVITAVSNLRPIKGVEMLVRAIEKVDRTFPNIKLLLAGAGKERTHLEALANSFGLSKKIIFLGSREDIPRILEISDIGVLGSLSEGLSNSLMEYMASGLPIVCTRVGGNPELVEDGVNGFLVPPNTPELFAEALNKLLTEPSLRKKMGQESYKKARDMFSISQCVNQTENLYERLIR